MDAGPTLLAVADADSYLKWSAATLGRLPADWRCRQLLIRSPTTPSVSQAVAATGGPVEQVSLLRLELLLRRERPDVVLLACTGPTVRVLTGLRALTGPSRPVLVSGLPGISIPASPRAVEQRRGCDLLVVHSRRERRDFAALAEECAPGLRVALGRLPFLADSRPTSRALGTDVVFAAQAKVPPERADREAILLALAETRPPGSTVVKVRALAGEQQTHHEQHPYPELWAGLVADGRVSADAVRFQAGAMGTALASARSLVTVSSTAALEAIAAGVPLVVLSDFGVDAVMINEVFVGSGCLGTLADVRAGRAYAPDPAWLADNYFHPVADDDLVAQISTLLVDRRAGSLPARPRHAWWSASELRARARLLLPGPLARHARLARLTRGTRANRAAERLRSRS